MDVFLDIGRRSWDVDRWYVQEEPIYDTDIEIPMIEFPDLVHVRQPNRVEVLEPFSLVVEQSYPLILRGDSLHPFHDILQPTSYSNLGIFAYKNSAWKPF